MMNFASLSLVDRRGGPGCAPRAATTRMPAMGMRVRMGPFSVSSRGRVGVSAGPVSFYGGGSRRSRSNDSLLARLVAICVVIGIVVVVVMWPLSLWGHAIHLTPSWHQLMHRNK